MNVDLNKDPFLNRISIAECRKILKDEALTDEQVLIIRDLLYIIAEIDYRYHEQRVDKPPTIIIPLNTTKNDEKKSHSLRPRKYRRAS